MSEEEIIKEIITNLKKTDEFKRSQAIAGCITFLANKIKELELDNNNLNQKINDLTQKNTSESELTFKLKSELKVFKSQTELYKTKLSVTEELNKTLDQTISELKSKINNDKISFNKKCEEFTSLLNKYKNIIEELKKEKQKKENEINNLLHDKNETNSEKEKLVNEINKLKIIEENNKKLNTKIKKYEVLLYKMDLENQGYKDEIQKYQNQLSAVTGQNINFIPIYKIDLNSELENIDGNNDEKNNFNDEENNEADNEDNNEDNNNKNKETIDNNESNYINEDEKFKTSEQQINTEYVNENDNDNDNDDNVNYEENNSEDNNENKHIYNIKNK